MKISRYNFMPSPVFSTLYLLVGALMLALGGWQMQRAAEKIELQAKAERAANTEPVNLSDFANLHDLADYTQVMVSGKLVPQRQLLWDNRTYKGRAGFEVITPLQLMSGKLSGKLVLINRGWTMPGASRKILPEVPIDASTKPVSFVGVFTRPSKGFSSGAALDTAVSSWPRILQHLAYDEIAKELELPVVEGLVQIVRGHSAEQLQVAGVEIFENNWQPVAFGPERHYGYAFQWWAMLATLTVLFIVLNTQKIPDTALGDNASTDKASN